MSGHPNHPPDYGYGAPPGSQPHGSSPYGTPPPQGYATPYGAPPGSQPYGAPPGSQPYGSSPYGAPPPQHQPQPHGQSPYVPVAQPYGAAPPASPYDHKPPKEQSSSAASGYPPSAPNYSSPFASLVPSNFPPGTDPNVVACFGIADQDGSGIIDDKELQRALSSYNQSFSLRTVHLLMYLFTNSNARKIGPKEFTAVFYSLQSWRDIFERFDRDRSGKIDSNELREALQSLGFAVSPLVLDLLVSKFDKTGGKSKAIEYDNFIECCLTVKGLTEKFKEKDKAYSGSASFTYEAFMLTVLPFLIA
ncbi:calcium-binding protein CBP-like [Juglans regia]|uniref:Calcium-binding protein CBP-like n=2 Tax=Juglans regia TaxID=51240 RepID=A0A2I4DP04_JUGRE|nr:calcium-binding protein CBP-like [Juglans regia]